MQQNYKQMIVEGIDAQTFFSLFRSLEEKIERVTRPHSDKVVDDTLFTRKETATYLKVSLPTLHEWTKKGLILSYRAGREIRYKESEVRSLPKPIYTNTNSGIR